MRSNWRCCSLAKGCRDDGIRLRPMCRSLDVAGPGVSSFRFQPTGYRVTRRIETGSGAGLEQHHMFLLRSNDSGRRNRLLLISATGTWCAYNNWGGSNHYEGISGSEGKDFSPILSLERPLPRGFVVLPDDAPRAALAAIPAIPDNDEPVSYPHMEWAYANGYSKKYASTGWAS